MGTFLQSTIYSLSILVIVAATAASAADNDSRQPSLTRGEFQTDQSKLAGPTAGALPSGKYNCHKISGSSLIHIGTIEVKGNTYRGIVDGEGKFAPYSVDGSGNITWSLDGFPDGWKLTSSKYVGNDSSGKPKIELRYLSKRGAAELMDCVVE